MFGLGFGWGLGRGGRVYPIFNLRCEKTQAYFSQISQSQQYVHINKTVLLTLKQPLEGMLGMSVWRENAKYDLILLGCGPRSTKFTSLVITSQSQSVKDESK